MPAFQLVAHRGYPERYPDNSMTGILAALEAGAGHLEIDIQFSSSGTPWLFHDESLQRVCGLDGRLVDLDDADISELRACESARFGSKFKDEPVARLSELAHELCARPNVFTFVEIKPVAVEAFGAETVVDAVTACLAELTGSVAIISFSMACLRAVAERTIHPLGLILESWDQLETDAREIEGAYIFCNYEKLPPEGSIDLDAQLAVYEVVDPELARRLGARGAKFVETFAYPEMTTALGR